jgi:hypothetical protein
MTQPLPLPPHLRPASLPAVPCTSAPVKHAAKIINRVSPGVRNSRAEPTPFSSATLTIGTTPSIWHGGGSIIRIDPSRAPPVGHLPVQPLPALTGVWPSANFGVAHRRLDKAAVTRIESNQPSPSHSHSISCTTSIASTSPLPVHLYRTSTALPEWLTRLCRYTFGSHAANLLRHSSTSASTAAKS